MDAWGNGPYVEQILSWSFCPTRTSLERAEFKLLQLTIAASCPTAPHWLLTKHKTEQFSTFGLLVWKIDSRPAKQRCLHCWKARALYRRPECSLHCFMLRDHLPDCSPSPPEFAPISPYTPRRFPGVACPCTIT